MSAPVMSNAGEAIWMLPLTPVGATAWITLPPMRPASKTSTVSPPTCRLSWLGSSARTSRVMLPPLAPTAVALACTKPVFSASTGAVMRMLPPAPALPVAEVVM